MTTSLATATSLLLSAVFALQGCAADADSTSPNQAAAAVEGTDPATASTLEFTAAIAGDDHLPVPNSTCSQPNKIYTYLGAEQKLVVSACSVVNTNGPKGLRMSTAVISLKNSASAVTRIENAVRNLRTESPTGACDYTKKALETVTVATPGEPFGKLYSTCKDTGTYVNQSDMNEVFHALAGASGV